MQQEKVNNILVDVINNELPLVLFLGQEFLSSIESKNAILDSLRERLKIKEQISWSDIAKNISLSRLDIDWLGERFQKQILPEVIIENLKFPWGAVFTTSIDSRIAKHLETNGRQPETIIMHETLPKKIRSKFSPPIYFLYSKIDESLENIIPTNSFELKKRQSQNTDNMLSKLYETVTSLGLLVIEGYNEKDWLEIDTFLSKIPDKISFRILWCGIKEKPKSDFFDYFYEKGLIITDNRFLHQIFNDLKSMNLISFNNKILSDEPGIITIDENKYLEVPPAIKLKVEASASIIDDAWTDKIIPINNEEESFKQFHGGSSNLSKCFEGVILGYSIKRTFEKQLEDKIQSLFKSNFNKNSVVILNGQTATGKSIALVRLAIYTREELHKPVLFARDRIPNLKEIDEFCQLAENQCDATTLIICDCNTSPSNYYELSSGLSSRGRKAIIVGSSYNISYASNEKESFIDADSEINEQELNSITSLINKYVPHTHFKVFFSSNFDKKNLLALLYRFLKVSRPSIMKGITSETKSTEKILKERTTKIPVTREINSNLSEQLINAGIYNKLDKLSIFNEIVNSDESITKIIDYVMSVGRLNCFIPLNLLIRVLNDNYNSLNLDQIGYVFKDLDIFRWKYTDDEESELLIGPRLPLEADLICQRRFADKEIELSYILDLIGGISLNSLNKNYESEFIYRLLNELDKDGIHGDEFAFGFLEIAEELTKLRLNKKFLDSRLMLRESSFRRAYLKYNDSSGISDESCGIDRNKILNDAREAIEIALNHINYKKSKIYNVLLVERASIYGYLSIALTRQKNSLEDVWSNYQAANIAAHSAMIGYNEYFPIDVILWTSIDILNSNIQLNDNQKAELLINIDFMLSQVDENKLPPGQIENFLKQKERAAKATNNHKLQEESITALIRINPSVAYYLLAKRICGEIFEKEILITEEIKAKAKEAYYYLHLHLNEINNDKRCIILMIEYFWAFNLGKKLFQGERQPILGFNIDFLHTLEKHLNELNDSTEQINNKFKYLEAVVLWLLDKNTDSLRLWKELEKDTEFEDSSRIIKRLYFANDNLEPEFFSARITQKLGGSTWNAIVNKLGRTIVISDNDFKNEILQKGKEIKKFVISFNYLSPIADTRFMEMNK